ncbi:ead/Ea22-like family protein [Enterobacter sp. BNK-34]|uniref:ead/Ea22-like family protein n=1 Tax=Enterobacter sp. BNK-34 TaxID=3376171 RepID=UPI003B433F08
MSNFDKRALRERAESTIGILENISGFEPSDIDGDTVELRFETEDGFDTGCDVSIVDQCQKAADVVRALLDELEAAHELVELQRFKLERQAEDLHQAKSLESIHREKRFEVEREFSDYKHSAESNSTRLAKEVCRLEDELIAAGIRINRED